MCNLKCVMKLLTVVVKPFRAEAVRTMVAELGLLRWIHEAKGYSRQKGYLDRYQAARVQHRVPAEGRDQGLGGRMSRAAVAGQSPGEAARTGPHRRRQGVPAAAGVARTTGVLSRG